MAYSEPLLINRLWNSNYRALREAIVTIRKNADLTQRALAAIIHRQPSYVAKIELGERKVDFLELLEICEACSISITDFHKLYLQKLKAQQGFQD